MSAIRIGLAETDEEILECHAVMAELRPHVGRAELLERVRRQQREGYRLLALREGSVVVAVAGFRVGHNLAWGRYLYVDDLVTAERLRSTGHGQRLMDWLREHDGGERLSGDAQSGLESALGARDPEPADLGHPAPFSSARRRRGSGGS